MTDNSPEPTRFPRPAAVPASPRVVSSELFRGQREVVIVHRNQKYRLSITKADKLILTK